jgi:hypothetical protein
MTQFARGLYETLITGPFAKRPGRVYGLQEDQRVLTATWRLQQWLPRDVDHTYGAAVA